MLPAALLSSPPPPLVINQNLYPKLGFDPAKFEPIIVMAQVPNALIVNPNKIAARGEHGIRVSGQVPIDRAAGAHALEYLRIRLGRAG